MFWPSNVARCPGLGEPRSSSLRRPLPPPQGREPGTCCARASPWPCSPAWPLHLVRCLVARRRCRARHRRLGRHRGPPRLGAGRPVRARPGCDSGRDGPLTRLDLRKLDGHRLPAHPCGRLLWRGARRWAARGRGPCRGLCRLSRGHPGGYLRGGAATPVPGQRPGYPSPAVTPTNLLCNVVSTPGALYRHQHQTGGRLALTLMAGTLPGVIAGSAIRAELVPGPASLT